MHMEYRELPLKRTALLQALIILFWIGSLLTSYTLIHRILMVVANPTLRYGLGILSGFMVWGLLIYMAWKYTVWYYHKRAALLSPDGIIIIGYFRHIKWNKIEDISVSPNHDAILFDIRERRPMKLKHLDIPIEKALEICKEFWQKYR